MPQGQGFTVQRVKTGGSKGVIINRLGRRRRSPSDVGDGRARIAPGLQRISNAKLAAHRELEDEMRRAELYALPEQSRRAAIRVALDTGNTVGIDDGMIGDADAWEDLPLNIPVPDHEVLVDLSHEGGDNFQFLNMAQDAVGSKRKYASQSKQSRRHLFREAWQTQMPVLYNSYMQYKYGVHASIAQGGSKYVYICVLGIEGYEPARGLPQDERHDYLNETLLFHGLLGASPLEPELAIPIPTLELYRRCRLRCPQFSVQQWMKVLCDLANINYTSTLREQFSDAFDAYLNILRHVDDPENGSGPRWTYMAYSSQLPTMSI
ncbi:hypothetical protein JB92DRAFT_3147061 [Gautieria morchelliformis]|nr:hypothetical protein JB92DRAFT_3147061 [Gautieria morchelliformis]